MKNVNAKKAKKEVTPYSKEWLKVSELNQILSMPDIDEKHEIWMLMMYIPALRVSEAINVRVRDIDIHGKCIEIWNAKGVDNKDLRKAPVTSDFLKRVNRYIQHNKLKDGDFIMFSNKSKQVNRSHVYVIVNELCKKAGINKKIGTHTFRRSRAQHLLDSGVPLISVSRYLRHKNIETTMHYLHYSIEDLQRELLKYDEPMQMV
ncbi:tyrosine-type recombinase/integrase [Methanolobus psychrotolerans]|uniref:tyrosine-type recombinase/integrase n=1 Tax=Methanolobus psychrotolerans TaxID=1874706 RepID=UPI000B9197C8|nr:site-specific integrase [Methanolobus psychrotolerans]